MGLFVQYSFSSSTVREGSLGTTSVSYTHLDVYKRQGKDCGKGIYQRKDGLYSARFVDKTGKRHEKYFQTIPEARNWMEDVYKRQVQALDDMRHGVIEIVGRSQHIGHIPVSYTHLDVYKRQFIPLYRARFCAACRMRCTADALRGAEKQQFDNIIRYNCV